MGVTSIFSVVSSRLESPASSISFEVGDNVPIGNVILVLGQICSNEFLVGDGVVDSAIGAPHIIKFVTSCINGDHGPNGIDINWNHAKIDGDGFIVSFAFSGLVVAMMDDSWVLWTLELLPIDNIQSAAISTHQNQRCVDVAP